MDAHKYKKMEMIAYEGFIRRASQLNLPFMLKGSYVTRQYFTNPEDRTPADLDWVYMDKLSDELIARQTFNEWATLVTELDLLDGVKFRSFKENEFWRMIDYAMADDFPTVNTDIRCFVNEEKIDFSLDVSFNLNIEQPPVPLMYKPIVGEPFFITNTVPLSLQVSWKIHQTLVRPRFKDLFDLMYLVKHPTFNKLCLKHAMQALINECKADNVDLIKLEYFLNYDIEKLFPHNSLFETWAYWRHKKEEKGYNNNILLYDTAEEITDVSKLPDEVSSFFEQFKTCMQNAGFDTQLLKNVPKDKLVTRITYGTSEPTKIQTSFDKEIKVEEPKIEEPNAKETKNEINSNSNGVINFIKKLFK
jgi:hypothetical protein